MFRETADISQFCELAWYNWIMYHPVTVDYPDEVIWGKCHRCRTSHDHYLLQYDNGDVVYHSTYRPLTVGEQADLTVQEVMITFKKNAEEHLGTKLTHSELEEVSPSMPVFVLYADKNQNQKIFPNLDEEIMPEVGDKYMHASVIFSCGS